MQNLYFIHPLVASHWNTLPFSLNTQMNKQNYKKNMNKNKYRTAIN